MSANTVPTRMLIQNKVEICSSVTCPRWTVAVESPKSRKRFSTPVKAITIPTRPNSVGASRRASTIKEPIRSTRLLP